MFCKLSPQAMLVSASEGCAFFAHRKATDEYAAGAAAGGAAGQWAGGAPAFGPWVWHRVPLPACNNNS